MDTNAVVIVLTGLPRGDQEEREVNKIVRAIRRQGLEASWRHVYKRPTASFFTKRQAKDVKEIIVAFAAPTVGVVGTVLGTWLQARYGRKVHVKFGDKEIDASSPEEVQGLLKLLPQN